MTNAITNATQAGFKWITNENPSNYAYITVDAQLRLYFNKATRDLLGVRQAQVGYDFANKRIVVADPNIVRPTNVKPHSIDKRGYASARPFLRTVGLRKSDLPLRYVYLGKDYGGGLYPKGSYVYGLDGEPGEDGAL